MFIIWKVIWLELIVDFVTFIVILSIVKYYPAVPDGFSDFVVLTHANNLDD